MAHSMLNLRKIVFYLGLAISGVDVGVVKYGLLYYYVDLILSKVKVVIFMSHAKQSSSKIVDHNRCSCSSNI